MKYHVTAGILVPFIQKYYKSMFAAVAAIFLLVVASMTLSVRAVVSPYIWELTQVELDNNWVADRTYPTGGVQSVSAFGRNNVAQISLDSASAHPTITFHRTEGIQTKGDFGDAVQVDLYLDSSWSSIPTRNGFWTDATVGADPHVDGPWGIIEFTSNNSGYTGWRVWDSTVGWTNLPSVSFSYDEWVSLKIELDEVNQEYDFYINDNLVHTGVSAPSASGPVTHLGTVILNSYNYGLEGGVDYMTHWSGGFEDIEAPEVGGIVINDQTVESSDVRNANCEPIKNFYNISGEVDLSATITDTAGSVENARYKVRKVNAGGCTVSNIFSSGFINMSNTTGNVWEDLAGFDTSTIPDGEYTIMLQTTDSNGNTATNYVDILVDNTTPPTPTNLWRVRAANTSQTLACGDVTTRQILYPTWDAYTESDFSHYEYNSFNNGTPGLVKQVMPTNQFVHSWTPPADGNFGFQVRTVDLAGNTSEWSNICDITYDSVAPDVPTLVSPANNSTVNGINPVANDWEDVFGASYYVYRSFNVDEEGDCIDEPIRFTENYTESQTNTRSLPDGLSFCWQVKAVDVAGNESGWSERWKVTSDYLYGLLGDFDINDDYLDEKFQNDNGPKVAAAVTSGAGQDTEVLADTDTLSDTGNPILIYAIVGIAIIVTTATLATISVKNYNR